MTRPLFKDKDAFAASLVRTFGELSRGVNFSEVQQFRALMASFRQLGYKFHVEEYHGPKHQVYFNGSGAWGRSPARCELCDVVIVSYTTSPWFSGRLTFLQAKLSKEKHCFPPWGHHRIFPGLSFKANLEQWDLLARRPAILPCPPFQAPAELLRDAAIPSVGSFGVFHRSVRGRSDFFYASADILRPDGSPTRKHARLEVDWRSNIHRTFGAYEDTSFCYSLRSFARELYSIRIGTPIDAVDQELKDSQHRIALRGWLKQVLYYHLETSPDREGELARELIKNLDEPDDGAMFTGQAPALVIIRGEADEADPPYNRAL